MQTIGAVDVEEAVQGIIRYLEDARDDAPKVIYFDGWCNGLGASAVLRAIAERPPASLRKKFDKIIHLDCTRWESRRSLQRAIADELGLSQEVAADFDRRDEEEDFAGVDHGSRAEIGDVARVIARNTAQHRCLVVFLNGSDEVVDLSSCGVVLSRFFSTKVLWTFGGRFRLQPRDTEDLSKTNLVLAAVKYEVEQHGRHLYNADIKWNGIVEEEAREVALYTRKHGAAGGVTPEIATQCCLYLLSLHPRIGRATDCNWSTHAASYWVCDGIIGGGSGQLDNQAWEIARDLQQQMRLEGYSSGAETVAYYAARELRIPHQHWIFSASSDLKAVPPWTTSLFFAQKAWLPSDSFLEADQLRVLKLCRCTFSFSSPPFHCCRNLRFLGLDRCKDHEEQQPGGEEEERAGSARAVEIFQRLWVLDVCHTEYWKLLDSPLETPDDEREELAAYHNNIREVHINNGRIWRRKLGLAWRRLPSLRRLRVVHPTSSWETAGTGDEFMGMVNLEHLDLSGNSTMHVLPPSLSTATGLKTLVLDGCVGLERVVGPQSAGGLPPSLESFSLDMAGSSGDDDKKKNEAIISCISLAGCARLSDFRLRGPLPKLEELDLSHTAVERLDLRLAQVGNLERLLLVGCEKSRSISWPRSSSVVDELRLVCINTRADIRFLQSLLSVIDTSRGMTRSDFKLNLCLSSSSSSTTTTGQQLVAPPKPSAYHDVCIIIQQIAVVTVTQPQQPREEDFHMEIGEGVCDVIDVPTKQGRINSAIGKVLDKIKSLHVHDSSSITTVTPEHIIVDDGTEHRYLMNGLKWCHVEKCPKLNTVFPVSYFSSCFSRLETFWAAHLLMARSIWRPIPTKPWVSEIYPKSFTQLQAIYLHSCPRIRHVLPLSSTFALYKVLETLHILCCGDLKQAFPVEEEFLEKIARHEYSGGMLWFPRLKELYLHDLPSLQQICEAKMFAPNLETIYIRGCWGLRRLPATTDKEDGRPPVAVDCEKDWWDKLEWDGVESGHHPSLFQPRHSRYYKKRHLRTTVLR